MATWKDKLFTQKVMNLIKAMGYSKDNTDRWRTRSECWQCSVKEIRHFIETNQKKMVNYYWDRQSGGYIAYFTHTE